MSTCFDNTTKDVDSKALKDKPRNNVIFISERDEKVPSCDSCVGDNFDMETHGIGDDTTSTTSPVSGCRKRRVHPE